MNVAPLRRSILVFLFALIVSRSFAQLPSAPVPGTWTQDPSGPIDQSNWGFGTTAGRITSIAIDPTTSGSSTVVYIGAAGGGVWKSSNNGATWTPLTDSQASLVIGSLAIDPNNHNIIYAGTGEMDFGNDAYYGEGILKSTNGGASWTLLGQSTFGGPIGASAKYQGGSFIGSLAVQPGAAGTPVVLAGTQYGKVSDTELQESGIWRSTDGGASWTRAFPTTDIPYAFGTSVFWENNTTAFAAIGNVFAGTTVPTGVYISTDSGASWTPANGSTGHAFPGPGSNAGWITLAPAPSAPGTIYASAEDMTTGGLLGMFKTTDSGANWNPITTPLGAGGANDYCGSICWYSNALVVNPTNPNIVFAGGTFNINNRGGGLFATTTGGIGTGAWTPINPPASSGGFAVPPSALRAIIDGPNGEIWFTGDGGVWSGTPITGAPVTFTEHNDNLPTAPVADVAGLADFGTRLKATFNNIPTNVTVYVPLNPGSTTAVQSCQGGLTFDPANPDFMMIGCSIPDGGGPQVSTTGGLYGSWSTAASGINSADRFAAVPPVATDCRPDGYCNLYFGSDYLYQSTNPGSVPWTPTSATPVSIYGAAINSVAVGPPTPAHSPFDAPTVPSNNLFAGAADGTLNYSTDTGVTWTKIATPTLFRAVTSVVADLKNATNFYATYGGFSGFGDTGHVFQCSTTTNSCTEIDGNLPNIPVNHLLIDPDFPSTLYLATDAGVYTTSNSGASWTKAGSGLPNVVALKLVMNESTRTLTAATHGRDVWNMVMPAVTPASITSPVAGSKLTSATATFNWVAGSPATGYSLTVGTTPGSSNIDYFYAGTSTSHTFTNLPTNGGNFYVTLNSLINGVWHGVNYTYIATGAGSAATMTSPALASTFSGSSQAFTWTAGTGISNYTLYIGSKSGAHDIAFINAGSATSKTVTGLPTNGEEIYISLYSLNGATWLGNAYHYYASGTGTGGVITSPAPGSTLTSSSATFVWSAGNGISNYTLYVGTTPGAHDIAFINAGTSTSKLVSGLPFNGSKFYVTVNSLNGTHWISHTSTFTASTTP